MTFVPTPPDPVFPTPPTPAAGRPSRTPGIVAAVVLLGVAVLLAVLGSLVALVSVAFLDSCPPPSCSVDAAASTVVTAIVVAGVVLLAGLVTTIVAIVRRRTPWAWALGTVVAEMLTFAVAALAYGAAVS
ncbi:hypothetical protein [Nocardioides sp.]|uniref:hypothetical protein n=1 Tax=Nocardioides sp. TaxID=35761 RepID=UPI003515D8D7